MENKARINNSEQEKINTIMKTPCMYNEIFSADNKNKFEITNGNINVCRVARIGRCFG